MSPFLKKLLGIVLIFEILLFLMLYYFGPNGWHVITALQEQKKQLTEEVNQLSNKIVELEIVLQTSQTAFEKEKMARERLLMKKDNETVYFKK
ncbi:MAG: hypothetical protein CL947_00080 [Epsilonproteobacteria bacterium]|nr:hypothetical protein [Campylobacterota bacterium]|tara:strand:+ start:6858 stop:7136 length:279 start_codon:yes stop_codon:yes gene_type:complete